MALVAGMRSGIDGGLARQELFGELFEGAGPFVPRGIGIRIGDENRSCALIGQELRTRVTYAPFKSGFTSANAGKENAAQVLDIAVGSVKGKLRIGGALALPGGGRDATGLVIQKQAAAIGEEVDAIGAKIEAGKAGFKELEAYMLKKGEADASTSGRQEYLENLINEFI